MLDGVDYDSLADRPSFANCQDFPLRRERPNLVPTAPQSKNDADPPFVT